MHFCAQSMKTLLTYLHCIRNNTPFKWLAEEIKKKALLVVNIKPQTVLALRKTCPDLNKFIKKIYFKIFIPKQYFSALSPCDYNLKLL